MKNFLESVMSDEILETLTICGSIKNFNLMEKYEAIYSLKNNVIYKPINYSCTKREVETFDNANEINMNKLVDIHKQKIYLSDGIIVVTSDDMYFGQNTIDEIIFAYQLKKPILFTNIPYDEREKYYFNNDKTYPLYMLKEEYK